MSSGEYSTKHPPVLGNLFLFLSPSSSVASHFLPDFLIPCWPAFNGPLPLAFSAINLLALASVFFSPQGLVIVSFCCWLFFAFDLGPVVLQNEAGLEKEEEEEKVKRGGVTGNGVLWL